MAAFRVFLLASAALELVGAVLHKRAGASGLAQRAVQEGVISDLWDGLDVLEPSERRLLDRAPHDLVRTRGPPRRPVDAGAAVKNLVVLGAPDTGTNLFLQTMYQNYQTNMTKACDWPLHQGWDTLYDSEFSGCRLWKHGLDIREHDQERGGQPVYDILHRKGLKLEDTVVVVMVRDPLSVMVSWKKAPYMLAPCLSREMEHFDQPCEAFLGWDRDGQHDVAHHVQFSSTMEVYNRYMRMHRALQAERKLHATVLATYEDMVFSPADIINEVGVALGWEWILSVQVFGSPSKFHGSPIGREQALEKLRSRSWLKEIPSDLARRVLCRGFDKESFADIVDNKYDAGSPSKSYSADCEGYA